MLRESTASENAEASSGEIWMPVGADMVVVADEEQECSAERAARWIGPGTPEARSGRRGSSATWACATLQSLQDGATTALSQSSSSLTSLFSLSTSTQAVASLGLFQAGATSVCS